MLMADQDLSPSFPKPKPNSIQTLDESCSIEVNKDENQNPEETLIEASPMSLEEEEELYGHIPVTPMPQILPVTQSKDDGDGATCSSSSDLPVDQWKLLPPPRYDTETHDDAKKEGTKPEQEPMKRRTIFAVQTSGVGAALANRGNSCFLNSVLQCLTHTVPFVQLVRSHKYKPPCLCGGGPENFCVIYAIQFHLDRVLRPLSFAYPPIPFLENLNFFSPDFRRFQQEDAQEFLSEFLDKLETCFLDQRTNRDGDDAVSSQPINIVKNVFGGRLVSKLRCCNCDSVSEIFEPSVGISLEIEDVNNLWKALDSFTCVEELDERLTCDECKEKVIKKKQLLLDKLPLVAMFHLKRFKNNGYCMEKIFKHVTFPLELDLSPYISDREHEVATTYRLYAFVEHLGTLGYGHYCAYVRSAPKTWHKFDDDKVTRITEEEVLSKVAYMLFYVKEDTPWFSRSFQESEPLVAARFSPNSVLDPSTGECESNPQHVKTEDNSVSVPKEESNELEDEYLSATESSESSDTSDDDSTMEEPFDPPEGETEPNDELVPPLEVQNDDRRDDLVMKQSPRGRELAPAICKSGSPPKKLKTA